MNGLEWMMSVKGCRMIQERKSHMGFHLTRDGIARQFFYFKCWSFAYHRTLTLFRNIVIGVSVIGLLPSNLEKDVTTVVGIVDIVSC